MHISEMRDRLLTLTAMSVHRGSVQLSSGKTSDFYLDGKHVTLSPEGAYYVAHLLASLLEDVQYEAIGGLTIGADPLVGALCYHLHASGGSSVTGFIVRQTAKEHGLRKHMEGPELKRGDRVVIIDDVVTTGKSVRQAIGVLEDTGCQVVKILALVDREEGARENAFSGYDFQAIFTRREVQERVAALNAGGPPEQRAVP